MYLNSHCVKRFFLPPIATRVLIPNSYHKEKWNSRAPLIVGVDAFDSNNGAAVPLLLRMREQFANALDGLNANAIACCHCCPVIAGVAQEGPVVNQPLEMTFHTSSDLVLVFQVFDDGSSSFNQDV